MKPEKSKFQVEGTMQLGKVQRKFSKTVEAASENAAREKTLSLLGSNHGISRAKVKIASVKKS